MDANSQPRVVLVHDWLTGMRGGEKCLEILCRRWPQAKLLTLLHRLGSVSEPIERLHPRCSPLQLLPGVERYYRYLLPFMPAAASTWRVPPIDLVVSFSHCVAKAVRPPRNVPHVCYCFTPMRYAWHMREAYFGSGRQSGLKAWAVDRLMHELRRWDKETANRVTHFVAISKTVQHRIHECYGRSSTVIYPPVDTEFYCPALVPRESYYLALSAFAPYKRLDLAIEACNRLKRSLVIIGTGQNEGRLRALAGSTVQFLGWQDNIAIRDHLRRCRALIFPGEEDFGIVPVEAQACGAPVIAFGRGGATETVVPLGSRREPTGAWFDQQTTDNLINALEQFEQQEDHFTSTASRRQALLFQQKRFERELFAYLDGVLYQGHTERNRQAA
jgi:glycosyltransferase involved in cell wall biosynthesis